MNLRDQGFRFVFRAGRYLWAHPSEGQQQDIDCTDMPDDKFAVFVEKNPCTPTK